ncbi:MAG TPA: hypothetical protein VK853_10745 [Ilumatobacteraceae bacterium]|nr:hypothetical protein [Ilumatobacteraceae bacterium]
MTERSRTVGTLVLFVALVGAVGLIVIALPNLEPAPEPIAVALDFETFVPGVAQVQSRVLDVPVPSQVREAGVTVATGFASEIDWTFELCQRDVCRPIAVDDVVVPGVHRLEVTALLDAAVAPGADGMVAGRVVLVESSTSPGLDRSKLVWIATVGLIGVVLMAAVVHRTRVLA